LADSPLFEKLSDKKEGLAELREVIKDSIDNPPNAEEIQSAKDKFTDIFADGLVTPAEKEQIKTGLKDAFDSLGITPCEAAIFYIIGNSRSRSRDNNKTLETT
jgi:hypothetical protein